MGVQNCWSVSIHACIYSSLASTTPFLSSASGPVKLHLYSVVGWAQQDPDICLPTSLHLEFPELP